MRKLLLLLPVLILLAACNNREDLLLPPDLSAAEYLTGNTINAYADYLIKSANDDSYLYLPKTSIADSLVNYGDEIVFHQVSSFASRDSLGFQDATTFVGNTYEFCIIRGGVNLAFDLSTPLVRVYTDLEPSYSSYFLVNYSYYLQATPITPSFYGSQRAFFPLGCTGEFALTALDTAGTPTLQHAGSDAFHALLLDNSGQQLGINFSAAYSQAAGNISLSMLPSLNQTDQNNLQRFFPNAALESSIIDLSTTSSPGSNYAYLRYRNSRKGHFTPQWTYLSSSQVYSWPETDQDSGNANWWQDNSGLYSFLGSGGKYFLLSPLDAQNEVSLPLDGSLRQVFLQDLWFDLSPLSLDNTTLNVKLNPDITPYRQSYFQGSPFNLANEYQLFELEFYSGTTLLPTLPDDNWLEFGFRTTLSATENDRLFLVYRDSSQDFISFKTPSTAYDSTHYYRNGSYVYSGIASSGAYIYGSCTESSSTSIPYLKDVLYLQSAHAVVSWDNSSKSSFSEIRIDYAPSLPSHPWLSGEPLTLGSAKAVVNTTSYLDGVAQATLPGSFKLDFPLASAPPNLLLFSQQDYPRLKLYTGAESYTGQSFVYADGRLGIYPEYPGTLISAKLNSFSSLDLRLYPTQTFDINDILLYTYGHATAGQSAMLHLDKSASLADPYQVLSSQYSLTQSSDAYTVTAADTADYAAFEPMLFFKRSTRGQNLLVYESSVPYYRLYPYQQSASFDPWCFIIDNGYNGISLAFNGSYASFTDNDPHSSVVTRITSSARDTVLSLYQAQLVIPAFFAGTALPLSSSITLSQQSSVPGVAHPLAAWALTFQNPSGGGLVPNFYSYVNATQEPYIYLPISQIDAIPTARLFFINHLGQTAELTRVTAFSANYASEYTVFGNSFICTVSNPGVFYITNGTK